MKYLKYALPLVFVAALIIFVISLSPDSKYPINEVQTEFPIPDETIEKMTTEALIKSFVVQKGERPQINGSPPPRVFQGWLKGSTTLQAIMEREDLTQALYNVYRKMEIRLGGKTIYELEGEEREKLEQEHEYIALVEFICGMLDLDNSEKKYAVLLREELEQKQEERQVYDAGFGLGYSFYKCGRSDVYPVYEP
ncbi:MAG: hypothetical protein IJN37_01940 [Clostridia bacterium]|nr:hypothetical protein [Clostridia bacterium]